MAFPRIKWFFVYKQSNNNEVTHNIIQIGYFNIVESWNTPNAMTVALNSWLHLLTKTQSTTLHWFRNKLLLNRFIMLDKVKNVIVVLSGKGGVGKSTVSTQLSLALRKNGFKVSQTISPQKHYRGILNGTHMNNLLGWSARYRSVWTECAISIGSGRTGYLPVRRWMGSCLYRWIPNLGGDVHWIFIEEPWGSGHLAWSQKDHDDPAVPHRRQVGWAGLPNYRYATRHFGWAHHRNGVPEGGWLPRSHNCDHTAGGGPGRCTQGDHLLQEDRHQYPGHRREYEWVSYLSLLSRKTDNKIGFILICPQKIGTPMQCNENDIHPWLKRVLQASDKHFYCIWCWLIENANIHRY